MTTGPDAAGAFSLEPGPDLREMRDWVHGFAADVIRPAGGEWDEREETPWTILEEAAKLHEPVAIAEATIPITLKLPPTTVHTLRTYARSSGLSIGVIVTRALEAFLGALRRHG